MMVPQLYKAKLFHKDELKTRGLEWSFQVERIPTSTDLLEKPGIVGDMAVLICHHNWYIDK